MQIRHERPISDLMFKVTAPLKLTLETGKVVMLNSWSLKGVTYPEDKDILPKAGILSIPFQGVDVQFDVRFKEGPEKGELLFDGLSGRQRETLAIFYRSILSGKMATSGDMITSLDTPVDLVPMGETEEEYSVGVAKAKNRIFRVIWNVVFYLMFAGVVFGLIGGQIWTRLSQVSLQNARIVAPIFSLNAAEAAFVDRILVAPGDEVKRGDTLVELSRPDREADLEDVREDIALYERLTAATVARLEAHRAIRELDRDILREAFLSAVSARSVGDFVKNAQLRDVEAAWNALRRFDLATETKVGPFFDIERLMMRELEDQKTRLSRLKRDLGNTKDEISAADIVASADGVIRTVNVFKDQYIGRGTTAVTMEENTPRVVKAWLNEARSEAIYVGMPTSIRMNSGVETQSIQGTISDISALVDPTISDGYGIIVSVSFDNLSIDQTRADFRIDAPVKAKAIKDWGSVLPWLTD